MKRVTGIGGIFFNAKDPGALRAWYKRHLGIDVQEKPAVGLLLALEILHMYGARKPVQHQGAEKVATPAEHLKRGDGFALTVPGAHQGLVADDAAVGDAEYRLEVAAEA